MIILENDNFALTLNDDCTVRSLVNKMCGEECALNISMPLFSVVQDRPFNNEIKLSYMNKRTTFMANKVTRDGSRLTVGFELLPYRAYVDVAVRERYITFTLAGFEFDEGDYPTPMQKPPVKEFNLCQIAVDKSNKWGQWLNVCHTETSRIAVMSTSQNELCDSECLANIRVVRATAHADIKLIGCTAALVVTGKDDFLCAVEDIERDFNLPRGVESRRSELINASIWTNSINPKNVDEHIALCKKGGFRLLLIQYPAFYKVTQFFDTYGDCEYNEHYPNGIEDIKLVLGKIRAAGIIPGYHFLHTHIGVRSKYVTPSADHRLNLKKHFTLSRDLGKDETDTIYVNEKPVGIPDENAKCYEFDGMMPTDYPYTCRILKFGTELIGYTGFSDEYPYRFTGCQRGYHHTDITPHRAGDIGGLLDVSEYTGTSVYLDQNSDLLDEYGKKLAEVYNLGCEFVYFDGSEGVNLPYEYHIPNAQYRVYRMLKNPPIFCEGAAKAHFGWHMLSGANAFDVFPNEIFKKMIIEHPLTEAQIMKYDYTRVNFGWWEFNERTSPDLFEFGTSKAAACDCPMTVIFDLNMVNSNPRRDDVMEAVRRWEDVKASGWLTEERKKMLANRDKEYTLLIDEMGKYELSECQETSVGNDKRVSAFIFERNDGLYASIWDNEGSSSVEINGIVISSYKKEIAGEDIPYSTDNGITVIDVSSKAYIKANCDRKTLIKLLSDAKITAK